MLGEDDHFAGMSIFSTVNIFPDDTPFATQPHSAPQYFAVRTSLPIPEASRADTLA